MKIRRSIWLIIVGLVVISADCGKGCNEGPDCHKTIKIHNNSDSIIYYNYSLLYPELSIDCGSG